MSDFVLDDEAKEVSQPDTAPSFAVGGSGGGGGGASAAGGAQAIIVRSIAVKYIPSFIDGQGVVVVYNMMLWHWGNPAYGFFREFLDIHDMTQEQQQLYEKHRPNTSSTVNLIEDSPRKKLKGIGSTHKPKKCCVITDVAENPSELRAIHEKLQQMLAEPPPPSATQFDKDKFQVYKTKLNISADELVLQAKTAEPRFDIKFELHGTNVLMRDGELFMDHPIPKPLSFKAATSKHTGEKVHLHQLSHELDTPLPDFLAPLVELARKLEFNVTFL